VLMEASHFDLLDRAEACAAQQHWLLTPAKATPQLAAA
jgi:hypothetical protein